MKTKVIPSFLFVAFAAGFASFGLTGCNKSERADAGAKAGEVVTDTKDAISQGWDNVKSFTFEKRDDFQASAKAMGSKWEAQVSELRANYSEEKASASRKAAMSELKDSEADYQDKLAALGSATADTWDSAKQNVISSWDKLQAAYYKARAE